MSAVPQTPLRWQQAAIERIVRQTPRVVSVFLRTALGPHAAGQHVDIRLTAPDGYEAQRSYSIASAPGAPEIELAIERLEEGEVSPYFHEIARPGDTFEVRGPIGGHFVWRAQDGGPLLLIGGGSGVVPLMAIARHRANTAPSTQTLLAYSARQMKCPPIGPRTSNVSPGCAISWKYGETSPSSRRSIASSISGAPGGDAIE